MSEKIKLGDICDFVNGRAFKPSEWDNKGLPIVRIQNLNDENAEFNFCSKVIEEKYIIENNQLLFSWSGTPGTSFGAFFWNRGKAVLNQHIFKVIPKININMEFLRYLLNGNLNIIISKSHGGVGLQHITKGELEKITVDIPKIEEQEHIVNSLNRITEIIRNRKEQIKQFNEIIKSQFVEMFENEKYPKKSLIGVCEELFAGGDVKKEHTSKERTDKYKYPIYTNGEKLDGLYGYTDIVRVYKEAVTISGRGTIGFSCIRKEPFYPAVRLIVAVPNKNIINTIFLRQFIENKNYGGQGASIPQLTVPMIKNELIPVPPIELQNQFAEIVKQIDKQKFEIENSLKEMQELYESLMEKYFG